MIAGSLFLSSIAFANNDSAVPGQTEHLQPNQATTGSDCQIECLSPGKAEAVSLTMNDSEIRYALPRGVTSFIIHLDAPGQRRCFTLVNESSEAKGKLSIAISNERLAANNPKWSAVDGAVPFRHKRRFALSLIGVEAKFVKLTFQVDELEKVMRGAKPDERADRLAAQAP